MYWKWMQGNNKNALEASEHFKVPIEKIWEQINESKSKSESKSS